MTTGRRVQVGDFRIEAGEQEAVRVVLDRGWLSEGPEVETFERAFADYIGTRHAVATSSGFGALMVALAALSSHQRHRVARGAGVITTPLTYVATVNAILHAGLEPVFVDVARDTFGITPEAVEAALAADPRAAAVLLPVHLMGYACDMTRLTELAGRHGLVVVEDAAQAHGTRWQGRPVGTFGAVACYSFYVAHNIQAGEMGALVTDDAELAALARSLKAQGRRWELTRAAGWSPAGLEELDVDAHPKFTHDLIGFNFKTTEFQAALARTQLAKADVNFAARQRNVAYLNRHLARHPVLQLPPHVPDVSYLAYPLVVREPRTISRGELRRRLEARGIETRPLFGCIPLHQPAYRRWRAAYAGRLPVAEDLGANGFYIGCHQYLEQTDLDYIVEVFDDVLRGL